MTIHEDFTEAMQRTGDPDLDRRVMVMTLRMLARIEAEQAEANQWFGTITKMYREEAESRADEIDRLTAVVREIAQEMLPKGSQHLDIPGMARLQMHTTDAYPRVVNADALVKWARETEHPELLEPVPATFKPITALVKEFAAALGEDEELPAGMELVPEVTTMKITPVKGAIRGE